jgi:general stress protein 26
LALYESNFLPHGNVGAARFYSRRCERALFRLDSSWHASCSFYWQDKQLEELCVNKSGLKQYVEVLKSFDTAMLVTFRGPELRSRPMAIADYSSDGRIWFLTSIESSKLDELTETPNVNVSMQASSRFLSISGTTKATRDPARVTELWSPAYNAWFSDGKNDPDIIVLEVVPTYAEYWDNSGIEGVKTWFELGKSVVTGEEPEFDETVHQKVDFPDTMHSEGHADER